MSSRFMLRGAKRPLEVIAVLLLAVALFRTPPARAQIDVSAAVTKTCAVMSGQTKADGQSLQFLMLLDNDLSDTNPVALALQRGVLAQCPKAYLSYQQRLRVNNPYANGSLLGKPVTLLNSGTSSNTAASRPQDYALRCRGGAGMASAAGRTLVVKFSDPGHPAMQGLQPGQCGWDGRSLRADEPRVINALLDTNRRALSGVKATNAGGMWTFWVYNVKGQFFNTTAIAKGTPAQKP
jgi:hypothetical protein